MSSLTQRRLDTAWYAFAPDAALLSGEHTPFDMNNRGLAYGDGFFTTMAVQAGEVLWANHHRARVTNHARALGLAVDDEALWAAVLAIACDMSEGMLKLIVTRAPQQARGYGVTPDADGQNWQAWLKVMPSALSFADMVVLPNDMQVLRQAPCEAMCLQSELACLPAPLVGLKSLNCVDNVLASAELERIKVTNQRIGEALIRDVSGEWIEGSSSNVFYQLRAADTEQAHQWYTPPLTQSGVAGVMRQVIMDSYAQSHKPIQKRALRDTDLPNLRALFFCNAVKGILPVTALHLRSGEVVKLSFTDCATLDYR